MERSAQHARVDVPLLITGGDPAGVGPALLESLAPEIARSGRQVIYYFTAGPGRLSAFTERIRGSGGRVLLDSESAGHGSQTAWVRIVPVGTNEERSSIAEGVPSLGAGRLAFLALESAIARAQADSCAGLLTAPVSKQWIAASGHTGFVGHTDVLAESFGVEVSMLMHGSELSVIPLTIHVPIRDVPEALRRAVTRKGLAARIAALAQLPTYGNRRWALLGLNPHAGEGGRIGDEEQRWLNAAAEEWRAQGLPVDGPLPADAAFLPEVRARYRLVIGCYHDQVLTPFKALEGRRGINCTIGLPFLRTSPDHGTAFELAATGQADDTSMRMAWRFLLEQGAEALRG